MNMWTVPKIWNETAFILGGGPSLLDVDPNFLENERVIAVNDAGLDFYPKADILYFGDGRWWKWNQHRLHLFKGERIVTRRKSVPDENICKLGSTHRAFSTDPTKLGGACSGSSAINLAYLLGSRQIVLLGFDMHDLPREDWQKGYWHNNHQAPPNIGQRANQFIPCLEAWAPQLRDLGCQVLNATPGSALKCFPIVPLLEDVFDHWMPGYEDA